MGWFSVPLSHSSESLSGFSWLGYAKLSQIRELLRCNPPKLAPPLRYTLRISQATVNGEHRLASFPSSFHSPTNQPTLLFSFAIHCCAMPTFILSTFFSQQHPLLGSVSTPFFCLSQRPLCSLLATKCLADPQLRQIVSLSLCR